MRQIGARFDEIGQAAAAPRQKGECGVVHVARLGQVGKVLHPLDGFAKKTLTSQRATRQVALWYVAVFD